MSLRRRSSQHPPTTHRSSEGNSTTTHQSIEHTDVPPPPSRYPSFPAREDCWSEDATFTLIEAWGHAYLQLNRGNLRQKHWQEVADAVNARHGHIKKARRTHVQCKNRIDTIKKKYKLEKSKVLELGTNNYVSPWPFFASMDSLIGASFKPSTQTPTPTPTSTSPPPSHRKRHLSPPPLSALPPPPTSVPVGPRSKRPAYHPSTDSSISRRNFSAMAAAAAAIEGTEEDSDTSWSSGGNGTPRAESDVDAYHELAEAIGKFAEVYERVEEGKQRQMVELEKQRMEFTKDLELQRMKLLMESQVQLQNLKRSNRNSEADVYRSNDGDHSTSID